jgi:ComEC/Rec2-related protein
MVWVLSGCIVLGTSGRYGLAGGVVASLVAWALWRRSRNVAGHALLAALCAAVGAGAALRHDADAQWVATAAGRASSALVELSGRVDDFPRTGPYGVAFSFATTIDGRPVRVLVRASFFDVAYGDRYVLRGRLSAVPPASRVAFDARGLSGLVRVKLRDARRLDRGGGCPLMRAVLWPLHRAARGRLTRELGDRAALANGVLLGERSQFDRPTQAAIARLGIMHLIAISGMHLTTVAACVIAVGRLAPRWSGGCVLLAISLYAGVVGGVDSLTRAYLMALLLFGAHGLVRPVCPVDALGKALWLMLLASPLSIRSVGLQLSVAATFAVLVVLPELTVRRRPAASWGARVLAACRQAAVGAFVLSVAVEVFIAPLQLHHFGSLSAVGPVATVVFFVPVSIVLLGALALALLAGVPWAGPALANALEFASESTRALALAFAGSVPDPVALPPPHAFLYYGGVALAWTTRRRRWIWPWGIVAIAVSFRFGAS